MKIETKTAKMLNDTPARVTIGGRAYEIAPPTFSRLATISAEIAELEIGEINPEHLAEDVLREAGAGYQLARIIAAAIEKPGKRLKLCPRWLKRQTLADKIFRRATPTEAVTAMTVILEYLQLGDFFALTTFLRGATLTRATKVATEATAPGR